MIRSTPCPFLIRPSQIDPEVHTLVWPNGADCDPAILHDWPYEISWTVHHLSSHLGKTAERTA